MLTKISIPTFGAAIEVSGDPKTVNRVFKRGVYDEPIGHDALMWNGSDHVFVKGRPEAALKRIKSLVEGYPDKGPLIVHLEGQNRSFVLTDEHRRVWNRFRRLVDSMTILLTDPTNRHLSEALDRGINTDDIYRVDFVKLLELLVSTGNRIAYSGNEKNNRVVPQTMISSQCQRLVPSTV